MDPKVSAMPFPPLPPYPVANTENINNAKIIKNIFRKAILRAKNDYNAKH